VLWTVRNMWRDGNVVCLEFKCSLVGVYRVNKAGSQHGV
jgi:hypothetical protein